MAPWRFDFQGENVSEMVENSAKENADSPCVGICTTLFDDVCRGCGRTMGEVSNWVFFSAEEKQQVWQRIRAQGYPQQTPLPDISPTRYVDK